MCGNFGSGDFGNFHRFGRRGCGVCGNFGSGDFGNFHRFGRCGCGMCGNFGLAEDNAVEPIAFIFAQGHAQGAQFFRDTVQGGLFFFCHFRFLLHCGQLFTAGLFLTVDNSIRYFARVVCHLRDTSKTFFIRWLAWYAVRAA